MRQLANNRFFLAKLAKNGRKQSEDASVALSCPIARLLGKFRSHSGASVPASESTYVPTSASQPRYVNPASGTQSDAFLETTWRGFAAHGGVVSSSNGAGHGPFPGEQLQSTHDSTQSTPAQQATPSSGSEQSNAACRSDTSPAGQPPTSKPAAMDSHPTLSSSLPSTFPPADSSPLRTSSTASTTTTAPTSPLSPTPPTPAPAPAPAPAAMHAAAAAAATTTTMHTAAAAATSSSSSHGTYNEPRDGSFSGRVVQHDGSHAVHLLVSGSSSRDYNLRMVRCHARDELRFTSSNPNTAGAGAGGGDGALCSTGVARGEDVSFATFVRRQVRDTITATFLPAGYPDTTGQNYVRFMVWQGVHNVTMTANSVLASTFMLYAVGLGAGSIPTAGALNWVLKDGMGQLGTLVFGKTIAHNFDVHSKTWFFLSAVMLQAAAALELLTVLVPEHFLLMGSLANTLKGLAWMAAGSTRSVFHLSFARDNNIADVTAKGTSQYIFASLMGTAGGALMCAAVGQSGAAAAACFGLLAAATVGSAYLAVQAIPLSTLNATRLQLLVDAFLASISPSDVADRRWRRRDYSRRGYGGGGGGGHHRRDDGYDDDDDDGDGRGGLRDGGSFRASAAVAAADADDINDGARGGGSSVSGVATRADGTGFGPGRIWDPDRDPHRIGSGGSGAARRWPRPRAYRTVDRCYIGPSTHEYEMLYDDSLDPQVPTPLELSPMDPPLPYLSRCAERLSPPITVGGRLEHIVDGNANLLVMLLTTYKYAHFMVVPRRRALHVVLHERADPRDMVQAYLQACILRRRIRNDQPLPDPDEQIPELRLELQESLAAAERLTTIFMSTIEANGWTVAKVVVEAQRRRARWS